MTDTMSEEVKAVSYSEGEEELGKIENELSEITTSSDFFEQEKVRQKQKRDAEKAQDIRDAMTMGESVSNRDVNWLRRYEEALNAPPAAAVTEIAAADEIVSSVQTENATAEDSDSLFADDSSEESDELEFFEEADEDGAGSVRISLEDEDDSEREPESHA